MNKTVTANISGVVFHIEADAYEKLHQYLNTIKNYFKDSDGTDEIMADIEARIAELFKEKLGLGRDVITMENVQQVVEIMGEPEAYMDEDSSENYNQSNSSQGFNADQGQQSSIRSKKLYRDEEDNVLGGVCSGLAYYLGIDRIWLRIGFLIAVFGFGTGFFIYLILWLIIPKAKTTSEKLEMKGEPINVENIGNTIKDEFNNFKKKVDSNDTRQFVQKTESLAYRSFTFLGKVLKLLFKFFVKFLGVVFILAAISGIVALLVFMISGPFDMSINNTGFNNFWTTDIAQLYFTSSGMFYLGLIGLIIVAFLPLIGLFYGGAKILFEIPSSNRAINLGAISLFIIGIIFLCISAATTGTDTAVSQKKSEIIQLTEIKSDTINLETLGDTYSSYRSDIDEVYIQNDEIFIQEIDFDIIRSKNNSFKLRLEKSARGQNRRVAGDRAENVMTEFEIEGNTLSVSPLISFPYNDRMRHQKIKMSIAIPVGKTIYLTESAADIIYDIENETNMHDSRMIGHYWKMTKNGLICTDCTKGDYRRGRAPKRLTQLVLEDFETLEELLGLEHLKELKELKGLERLKELEKLSELEQLKELEKLIDSEAFEDLKLKINSKGAEININL